MKKAAIVLCVFSLLISCKKNSTGDPGNPPGMQEFPQTWIFTQDEAPDKYVFLKTNTANMFRQSVLQSYNLLQLAIDENCEFEVAQSRNEANNKDCFTIRLDKNKKIWCGVGPSSNGQETFMYALNTTSTDPGDGYKFFLHFKPKVNGVTTVAIESVEKPGWYVSPSPPGFQYAQNQVTMQQAASPAQAPAWQCR